MLMTDREVNRHFPTWCRCMELVFQTLAAQSLPIQTWYWQPYGFTESYFEMDTQAIAFSYVLDYAVIRHNCSILQKSRNFLSDRTTSSMAEEPPSLLLGFVRRDWTISNSGSVISAKRLSSGTFLPHVGPYQQICHYDQYRNREQEEKQNLDQVCRLKVMSSSQRKVWAYDMTAVSKGFFNRWWMSELKWQDITLKCCSPVRDRGEVVARCRGVLSILTSQPLLHPPLVRRNTADLITTTLFEAIDPGQFCGCKK